VSFVGSQTQSSTLNILIQEIVHKDEKAGKNLLLTNTVEDQDTTKPTNSSAGNSYMKETLISFVVLKNKQSIVPFILDEGHIAAGDWIFSLFIQKFVRATLVITGLTDINPNFLTSERIRELYNIILSSASIQIIMRI